jgi:hypothetical protein
MGTDGNRDESDSKPPSWAEETITAKALLPSYWPKPMIDAVMAEARRGVSRGAEPSEPLWERWFERALEDGVDDDLASLGRSLIREARIQGWHGDRLTECGWLDDGEAMLELALVNPERAGARWRALLDGDV